jgi:uncharacterized protein
MVLNMINVICCLLVLIINFKVNAFVPPSFTTNVVDEAHVLSIDQVNQLNRTIDQIHNEADVLAAIYIVSELKNVTIEEAAEKTFKQWKLGAKGKDNGILLLVSINDHRIKIEVGYGLEGNITDLHASRIIHNIMAPAFKQQNYYDGITKALNEIILIKQGNSSITNLNNKNEANGFVDKFLPRLWIWLIGIWAVPFLISFIGLIVANFRNSESLAKIKDKESIFLLTAFGVDAKSGLFVKLFLTVNPGLFVVIFPIAFASTPIIGYFFNTLEIIVILIIIWRSITLVRRLNSLQYFLLKEKKKEEDKINKAGRKKNGLFSSSSSSSTSWDSSSTASSSSSWDSSSSSSSDGGSSGGGGASGDW